MAKKIYLDDKPDPVFYTLLGISCHLKDYRLSFLLNQHLGFAFAKMDDLRVNSPVHKSEADFSFYNSFNEEKLFSYYLIANRSQDFILVPEMKQIDFILFVEGKCNKQGRGSLIKKIRMVPGILTAIEIDFAAIKNIENLLTDIEMHVMNIRKIPKIRYQPR